MRPERVVAIVALVLSIIMFVATARAHDDGQWDQVDPAIARWYRSLMMPDIPTASCCGEADSYWCDSVHVRGSKTFCRITDDRDDAVMKRRPIPNGTEIEIPLNKMNRDGNPTGHSVVFLSPANYVFCFVLNGGV